MQGHAMFVNKRGSTFHMSCYEISAMKQFTTIPTIAAFSDDATLELQSTTRIIINVLEFVFRDVL